MPALTIKRSIGMRGGEGANKVVPRAGLAQVARVRLDPRATRPAFIGDVLQPCRVAPHQRERAPSPGIKKRQRAPQPRARPRDDDGICHLSRHVSTALLRLSAISTLRSPSVYAGHTPERERPRWRTGAASVVPINSCAISRGASPARRAHRAAPSAGGRRRSRNARGSAAARPSSLPCRRWSAPSCRRGRP